MGAVWVNTKAMGEEEARGDLAGVGARIVLPTVEPFRQGAERLVVALEAV